MIRDKIMVRAIQEMVNNEGNDQELGKQIRSLFLEKQEIEKEYLDCCLCENKIQPNPQTGWKKGHNPFPLARKSSDRCCDDCNENLVLPARISLRVDYVPNDFKKPN